MYPKNITTLMLIGEKQEFVLFKCAFHFAEQGLNVWFISPDSFNEVPSDITAPNKDVLKYITFLYLKDYVDLVNQLNTIHTWHKVPNIIILNDYDVYSDLNSTNYSERKSAFLNSTLLDAASVCAKRNLSDSLLLVSCEISNSKHRIDQLTDLYCNFVLESKLFHKDALVNAVTALWKS